MNSCRGGRITHNQLSSARKVSVESTDHELLVICQMCLNRLENENQTAPTNEPAIADHELPATNDPIANCVWDDVIVSTGQTNMEERQKKDEQMKSEVFELGSSAGLSCQWCGGAFGTYFKGYYEEVGNCKG